MWHDSYLEQDYTCYFAVIKNHETTSLPTESWTFFVWKNGSETFVVPGFLFPKMTTQLKLGEFIDSIQLAKIECWCLHSAFTKSIVSWGGQFSMGFRFSFILFVSNLNCCFSLSIQHVNVCVYLYKIIYIYIYSVCKYVNMFFYNIYTIYFTSAQVTLSCYRHVFVFLFLCKKRQKHNQSISYDTWIFSQPQFCQRDRWHFIQLTSWYEKTHTR